jgi:CxxC motif-containing protein (DUF1111 family)
VSLHRITVALIVAAAAGCGDNSAPPRPLAGGETTVFDRTSNAFSLPAPNLTPEELDRHLDGDLAFDATFVTGGAPVNNGLGPLYNNSSCGRCHGRDGRGLPVVGGSATSQSLVRVSLPDGEPDVPGGSVSVPGLGLQIQDHGVYGHAPEALVAIEWIEEEGAYGDGTRYSLRRPALDIELPGGGALPAGVMTSLRQPPAVFGLGLLEAVALETLEELADPDDGDGDGVSGRLNQVWHSERAATEVGRFGHKANTADLDQQSAAAYFNDMGVANRVFYDQDGATDIDHDTLEVAAFYVRTLGVPARAEMNDAAARGEELFADFGCATCHAPELETGEHAIAALAFQGIQPFTDLLIHDLGEGLADGRPDFLADGREWRTAALWGLGLVQTVQPGSGYLHDGRARTLAEAILWHGGEAEAAREAFRLATQRDRDALLAFLASL